MKIAGSNIEMNSRHYLVQEHYRQEAVRYWRDEPPKGGAKEQLKDAIIDRLQISDQAKEALRQKDFKSISRLTSSEPVELEISDRDRLKLTLLEKMLSALFGKEFKFKIPEKIEPDEEGRPVLTIPASNPANPEVQLRVGWGFAYDYHEIYRESEKLSFAAKGRVQTADGRVIDFQINLQMSREFYRESGIQIRAGDAVFCDPLVINFEGIPGGLSDLKFSFDLDCDGTLDQISFTNPGSGFLAIDLNNDGKINDGSELFGPTTGNGFEELAKYDQDGNGWIDENDPIFHKLRIWTKDEQGNDQLFALGQKGVGAIYLGNVAAEFGLKNTENELLGQARRAGIFLKEDGTPGIVQEIDLVV
ncbi:MAG: hypothetical protein GX075_05965 [Firmicutes bacterium]|nr:hypothetical protein [Bacillota bacterium]